MLSIGLMSGTSMDGINAALIETDGKSHVEEIADYTEPYAAEMKILLKAAEYATRAAEGDLTIAKKNFPQAISDYLHTEFQFTAAALSQQIEHLAFFLHGNTQQAITFDQVVQRSTELHHHSVMQLLQRANVTATAIAVIGYHGQTLLHQPANRITIQIGDGKLLAELTGITTVNDFRSHDVAMGGQGAPFAPLYHHALALRDKKFPAAVVNCGGIANITVITDPRETHLIGFDTGPGNGLIDRYVKQQTHNREHMDADGKYGLQGEINHTVLTALFEKSLRGGNENFFAQRPPKSLDINDMQLIPELQSLTITDGCRTLEAFTAESIVRSIDYFQPHVPTQWILCGGGWNNPVIKHELNTRLQTRIGSEVMVLTADEAGWNSDAMEAQLFAYLAVRSLQQLPISVPGTTRVPHPLTGGVIHQP